MPLSNSRLILPLPSTTFHYSFGKQIARDFICLFSLILTIYPEGDGVNHLNVGCEAKSSRQRYHWSAGGIPLDYWSWMNQNRGVRESKLGLNLSVKTAGREDWAGKGQVAVNRTRGFVNLNRFKSGRAIKRQNKVTGDKPKKDSRRGKG